QSTKAFAFSPGLKAIFLIAIYTFAGKTAIINKARSLLVICWPFFTQSKTANVISMTPEASTIHLRKGNALGAILRKLDSCKKCKKPAPNNKPEYNVRKNNLKHLPFFIPTSLLYCYKHIFAV